MFEAMLKNVAKNVVTSPSCNMNRWADNHYALDIFDGSFDYIIDYVDAHSSVLYQCADFGVTGLHYIYDPTGCVLTLPRRFILSAVLHSRHIAYFAGGQSSST